MKTPESERRQPAHPARHRRVGQGRLRDEERDPARVDRLVVGERVALGDGTRRPAQAAQQRPELVLDDPLAQVLVGERLAVRAARVVRRGEGRQHVVVEEVGERPVTHVMEQPRHPHRLDDEALGRDARIGRSQARVQRARPEARLVHDAQAVREARVLGGGKDPACALELADPAQALEPGRVEQVLLGHRLDRQPGRRRLVRGEPLGQLDVAVDRVADEVDGRERLAAPPSGHALAP